MIIKCLFYPLFVKGEVSYELNGKLWNFLEDLLAGDLLDIISRICNLNHPGESVDLLEELVKRDLEKAE